jgi:outer membrane protein assembly factor BamB
MKTALPCFAVIAAVLASHSSLVAVEEQWTRFRGPNGSGVADSAGVPTKLDEGTLLWSVGIPGSGHGSPVVFGNRIFLLSAVPEESAAAPAKNESSGKAKNRKGKKTKAGKGAVAYQWLALCIDRDSGATVWEKRFDQRKFKGHRFNSAASSTPAVNADRVVFAWGTPDQLTLVSLSHDGEEQWKRDLGPIVGGHGFAGSPVLYRDLVVLNNDQEKGNGNLFALDAATGKTRWTVERKSQRISYSVPCVYEAGGREVLVFTNWQHGFTAIDPADGSVVADKSVFNTDTNERAISSPIATRGLVIGTCGFTANPKHCVAMRLAEKSEWEEGWRIERNVPHIPSVIAVGDLAYLIDDSGIGTCVDSLTGEEKWRSRIPGVEGSIFGSPVSDGKNIFFSDESGNLHVVAASGEFRSVGTNRLGELCRTTPVIVGDTILVRTETRLRAYRNP